MTEVIRDFRNSKVSDYLDAGLYDKVLIRFYHGLGDTVMFQPALASLRAMYPRIKIDLDVRFGQQDLWEAHTVDDDTYDIIFELAFPMSEYSHKEYTKGEWCCIAELGIEPPKNGYVYPTQVKSPLVGTHFFSTCYPDGAGCPESVAKRLHDRILQEGLIPIDTHMHHSMSNPKNVKFSWNTCAIEDAKAAGKTLLGVLQRLCGFAGVASGNCMLATTVLPPERILYLKNKFSSRCHTRLPVLELDVNQWDDDVVNKWIENIKKE